MEFSQDLIRGTVLPVILRLVSEREMYGYEIIQVVEDRTQNAFQWKEGTLYPWLHRLEADGLIASRWVESDAGRQRKYYKITRRGRAALAAKSDEWAAFAKAVNALLAAPAPA